MSQTDRSEPKGIKDENFGGWIRRDRDDLWGPVSKGGPSGRASDPGRQKKHGVVKNTAEAAENMMDSPKALSQAVPGRKKFTRINESFHG
jgi:hypothetical protein